MEQIKFAQALRLATIVHRDRNSRALRDTLRLAAFDYTDTQRMRVNAIMTRELDETINERAARAWRIAHCTDSNGRISVEETGRDCDGVQYWGWIHTCDANARALERLADDIGQYADGPFHLTIIHPDDLAETIASAGSRDTYAERMNY